MSDASLRYSSGVEWTYYPAEHEHFVGRGSVQYSCDRLSRVNGLDLIVAQADILFKEIGNLGLAVVRAFL